MYVSFLLSNFLPGGASVGEAVGEVVGNAVGKPVGGLEGVGGFTPENSPTPSVISPVSGSGRACPWITMY